MNTCSARPSMNWVSRRGASRKSSALRRRRRVEDEQVVAVLGVELEQLLHRHVLLRAGERGRELLVDAVVEDPVARLLVGGVLAHHLVEGRLGVEHHRPQLAVASVDPGASNRAGSTRRSVLPSSGSPSESASRLAGSMVSTATFLPRAAIPAAIAAEVVVLPTPPEPAQMQTRLPSSSSRDAGHQRASSAASGLDLGDPELGLEQERQRRHGRLDQLLAGGRAARAGRRARRLSETAARQATRDAPLARRGQRRRARRPRRRRSAPGTARSDRPGRPRRRPRSRRSRSSDAVSLTGISSGSATIATPVSLGVADEAVERPPPAGGSGRRGRSSANVRGVCRKPTP